MYALYISSEILTNYFGSLEITALWFFFSSSLFITKFLDWMIARCKQLPILLKWIKAKDSVTKARRNVPFLLLWNIQLLILFLQIHRALFVVMHFASTCGKQQEMGLVRTLQHLELQRGDGWGQSAPRKQHRGSLVDRDDSEGMIQSGQRHASDAEGSRTHTQRASPTIPSV